MDERKMEEEEEEKVAEEAKSETKPKKVIVVGGSRSSADGHPGAKRNLFKTKVNAVMNPTSLRFMAQMAKTVEVRQKHPEDAPAADVDMEQVRRDAEQGVTRIVPKRAPVSFID